MHIVFIVGSYYPNYSAVGKCVGNVADEMSKFHKVSVICEKTNLEQKDNEIFNNQAIIRVLTANKRNRLTLENKIIKSHGLFKILFILLLSIYKVVQYIGTIISTNSLKRSLTNTYNDALNRIDDQIDLIIPACMPFESVLSAIDYKKRNDVKVVPYLFDKFVESDTLHRSKFNRKLKMNAHKKIEANCFNNSDSILAMHSLKMYIEKHYSELNNVIYLEHPLIEEISCNETKAGDKINVSYIGGLYKNYVSPDYLLKLFSQDIITGLKLNFYIVGNHSDLVNEYGRLQPHKIINYGSVDKKRATEEMSNSNILISISENKGLQLSSKIFEYMSCSKPIIHFYNVDNDINLKILKKYPLALCLKQDINLLSINTQKFLQFCLTHKNSRASFEETSKIFEDATPEYTVKIINTIFNET